MSDSLESGPVWLKWAGLILGPMTALAVYLLLPRTGAVDGRAVEILSEAGAATLAVGALMAVWWLSEALPLEATALIPLALFPVLGVAGMKAAAAPYADEVIFLFLGGMMLGVALERWALHRRVALWTMLVVGTRPVMLVGGMMLATALISMWVSNTATAVMMLPIAVSVVALVRERVMAADERHGQGANEHIGAERELRNFATCLIIGVGYAATIGGVGTLIGTPPNAVLRGYLERTYGDTISFGRWLWIGIPILVVFLPASWVILTRLVFPVRLPEAPGAREMIARQLRELGPMSRGEWSVLVIFVLTAAAWIFRPQLARWAGTPLLTDAGVAIASALVMFLTPVDARKRVFVLDWHAAGKLPWGVLLLFGGGLSLAAAFEAHNVDEYVGRLFDVLKGAPAWAIVLGVTAVVVFVTEVGSNTAVTTTFLPIASAAAARLGVHPYLLCFPVAIGASYAFMMPTGTPPNALVFASGHVRVTQMWRAGIVLNVLSIAVITGIVYWAGPWLLGFERTVMPGPP